MQTLELQRLLDAHGMGMTLPELEEFRASIGGGFVHTPYREVGGRREQLADPEFSPNIVVNEGIAHILGVGLVATADITTWYCTMFSDNRTPLAGDTAGTPGSTEIDATDVTESIRQTWTGGSVTGTTTASVDNAAAVATYTCNTTGFTAWGGILIGGGTSAFGNTAGSIYASALFTTQRVLVSTDTIDVTYTFTSTDDGV